MRTVEILEKVKATIERGWCRGALAKMEDGSRVEPKDDRAVKFCILGALDHVCDNEFEVDDAGDRIEVEIRNLYPSYPRSLSGFNDSLRVKRPILRVIDKAIEKAKETDDGS